MYTLTTRAYTSDERDMVDRLRPIDSTSHVFIGLLLAFALILVLLILMLLGLDRRFWWIAVFALVGVLYLIKRRRRPTAADLDFDHARVEVLRVKEARVCELALIDDNEPILCFQIDDDHLLYLQGPWLRNPRLYGASLLQDDPLDERINGLPDPFGFPCAEFTLERFPHTGRVLSIRPASGYTPVENIVDALSSEYEFRDSEVFQGRLEEIETVLEKAHLNPGERTK